MNELAYTIQCILALEKLKKDYVENNIWELKSFENNPHHEYGRICLALKEAQKRHQDKLNDIETKLYSGLNNIVL